MIDATLSDSGDDSDPDASSSSDQLLVICACLARTWPGLIGYSVNTLCQEPCGHGITGARDCIKTVIVGALLDHYGACHPGVPRSLLRGKQHGWSSKPLSTLECGIRNWAR